MAPVTSKKHLMHKNIEGSSTIPPIHVVKKLVDLGYKIPIFYYLGRAGFGVFRRYIYLSKIYYTIPKKNSLNTTRRDKKIVVSLTTIPSRIEYVPYVLGSMMRQTMRPDAIILNLGEELFQNIQLPNIIKKFESAGVTIRYVSDLRPHTKYYYSLRDYADDLVITVDDDILYPPDLIEKLYQSYLNYPNAISCLRAHLIRFDKKGNLLPYNDWIFEYSDIINTPSMELFATGVGGVLYPPHSMHEELFNKEALKTLSLKADDVWLKMMQIMKNTPVVVAAPHRSLITVSSKNTQKQALCHTNVSQNENDVQIHNVLRQYNNYFGGEDTLLKRIRS